MLYIEEGDLTCEAFTLVFWRRADAIAALEILQILLRLIESLFQRLRLLLHERFATGVFKDAQMALKIERAKRVDRFRGNDGILMSETEVYECRMAYALRADVVSDLQRDDLVENFIALTRVAKVPTYQTQREADRLLAKSACPKCFHQLFAEILAGQHLDRP